MKVGDRVRVVATDYASENLANGQLGTVSFDGGHYVGVIMDNKHPHLCNPENLEWNFYPVQVEPVV